MCGEESHPTKYMYSKYNWLSWKLILRVFFFSNLRVLRSHASLYTPENYSLQAKLEKCQAAPPGLEPGTFCLQLALFQKFKSCIKVTCHDQLEVYCNLHNSIGVDNNQYTHSSQNKVPDRHGHFAGRQENVEQEAGNKAEDHDYEKEKLYKKQE